MDGEGGAASQRTGDIDGSAVRLDDALDDRESQAGSSFLLHGFLFGPIELLEDSPLIPLGNSDSGICHVDLDAARPFY